jgi:BirA family biotin operon repressor/biotin-[acetyl-CoA-carboxylase] ligase
VHASGHRSASTNQIGASTHRIGAFTNPVRLDRIDSTNRYLRDLALEGAPEGVVVLAEEQLAGRGRRDRTWTAPHGSSLLCSVLFRPRFGLRELHLLPSIVGLAALDALDAVAGVAAALKWPNDVLVGDAKLAGILAEIVGAPPAVVVGIGMNVAWPPGWPPDGELAELLGRATTVERAAGHPIGREQLCGSLLDSVGHRYAALATTAGRARASAEYRSRCSTVGRSVRLVLDSATIEGHAVDIDADGRLVVELADGEQRSFDAGDVVHLR